MGDVGEGNNSPNVATYRTVALCCHDCKRRKEREREREEKIWKFLSVLHSKTRVILRPDRAVG